MLSGVADLPLVMLAAWALQEDVDSSWHWAVAFGMLVGFVSGIPWYVPVISYVVVVALAQIFQKRVWQAPLLAMFSITFLGTDYAECPYLIWCCGLRERAYAI